MDSIIYLNRLLNRALSSVHYTFNKPTSLHMSVTHHCCLKCTHCDIWKINEDRKELTTEQMKEAIKKLRRWIGPFNLNIAGGEPFIRKDMVEIIRYSHKIGVALTITSSGYFIDEKVAGRLKRSGLRGINISLDSLYGPKHDRLRGVPGTYERARKAIDHLNNSPVKVSLATVIMKHNYDEVDKIAEWVEQTGLQGVNFQPIIQNFGAPYDPDWYKSSGCWPDETEKIIAAVDRLIAMKKAKKRIYNSVRQLELFKLYFKDPKRHVAHACQVGNKNFAINEYGDIMLCFFMKPIGNIVTDSPSAVWKSKAAEARRKQVAACKRNCNLLNCNFT